MEFGKIGNIEHINWGIPDADPLTQVFLPALSIQKLKTKVYIGAPAWGRKEWIGRVYPPKTKATDFLFHYSRNFNCIELNTTHYRIPNRETIMTWVQKVTPEFLFCPKLPQSISHDTNGLRDAQLMTHWQQAINSFGSNLGPCFLQLPPHFSYAFKAELFHFLNHWPDDKELAIELRHPSWFENGHVLPALVAYLQKRKIGLVILDVAGRRDLLHSSISAPYSFLRLIGNNLHPSDFARAKMWAEQIAIWQELGLQKFFFMVHEPDDIKTPEMTDWVIQTLNETVQAQLVPLAKPLLG